MRITFLGTSGSTPTPQRGLPSVAIERNGEIFLFDCGEGTQRQMMNYHVNVSRVKAVFLTHIHGDHTIGIAGLLRTMALNRRTAPLEVYAPKGSEGLKGLISFDGAVFNFRIELKSIRKGEIYKGKGFAISAFQLNHTVTTYGLVLKEDDSIRFIKDKVKRLGLKGKDFAELERRKTLRIKGKTIRLKDITVKKYGKKIAYVTDTRPVAESAAAARNADILIHESTYSEKEASLAKERLHSTSIEAAGVAKRARAKRLVLIHPSARYRDSEQLVREARKSFRNTDFAHDGLEINV